MQLMWAVDHELGRLSKRMESKLGITGRQRLVIRIIGRFPGLLAGQLAAVLHIHPGTLTGIIKRLERDGLIVRRAEGRDRRRVALALTAKGRELDVSVPGTVEEAVRLTLASVDPSEVAVAAALLRRFSRSLAGQ
jgi:DNA-binding MarR family transcriptional regulator